MEKAEIYKGIEFVRISNLPSDEQEQIAVWSRGRKITILSEESLWRDCIQFRDYKEWYENHYQPNVKAHLQAETIKERPAPKRNFTFGFMRSLYALLEKN